MRRAASGGFTLVEVLVALMVVAIGLAALMTAVSSTARTSGFLRDKTLAQWIALNRLAEVRLTVNRLAQSSTNADTGELQFANRTWHYDTRYFNTSIASMQRVVVRVWAGDAKTKGNPVAEAATFLGSAIGIPGVSNVDWTTGSTAATGTPCTPGTTGATTGPGNSVGAANRTGTPGTGATVPCNPTSTQPGSGAPQATTPAPGAVQTPPQ